MIRISNSLLTKIAVGVGVSVAAPIVYRLIQGGEPITARSLMKEGIKTYNQARIALAETKENISDLAAEAQAELEAASEETFEAETVDVDEMEAPESKAVKVKAKAEEKS